MNKNSRGSAVVWIIVTIVAIIVVVGGIYFLYASNKAATPSTAQKTSTESAVNDLNPNIPANQKTKIVIRQTDSTTQTFLVPNDEVESFIKSLPKGEAVVTPGAK